jgi:deoxyribodipyrimidine photo-lyase
MTGSHHSIHGNRIRNLNDVPTRQGTHVLYWMQQSQRAEFNHALEYAAQRANDLDLPLVVGFGLTDGFPDANLRHYVFMLEGLAETARSLSARGVQFVLQMGDPADVALKLGRAAALIVCDRGYLRLPKQWRERVGREATCQVTQVESDVIVPINTASNRCEFGARTLRPKLLRQRDEYLVDVPKVRLKRSSLTMLGKRVDLDDIPALCRRLKLDRSVEPVTRLFRGGTAEAKKRFRRFLRTHLRDYKDHRNQPQTDDVSHVSKYLHFGQVSPVWLALEAQKHKVSGRQNIYSFIDELLVRRELAMNWVEFVENYDRYESLPEWSRASLDQHRSDRRPHVYAREQLEAAATHDPYWNAAMREMRVTGYMHNHMRMYWGKKILEWSAAPETAHAIALAINNKYFLDGRDANSFANIAWIFGQHDRPWPERPIFGKVRYMNAAGLERKCDIKAYVEKVRKLTSQS